MKTTITLNTDYVGLDLTVSQPLVVTIASDTPTLTLLRDVDLEHEIFEAILSASDGYMSNPNIAKAALEAIRPHLAPVASGWMPIESAPMDGTNILLWDGKFVTEANYISEIRERDVFIKTTKAGDIYRHEKYEDGDWSPHNTATEWDFTHWMLLPQPPKKD